MAYHYTDDQIGEAILAELALTPSIFAWIFVMVVYVKSGIDAVRKGFKALKNSVQEQQLMARILSWAPLVLGNAIPESD